MKFLNFFKLNVNLSKKYNETDDFLGTVLKKNYSYKIKSIKFKKIWNKVKNGISKNKKKNSVIRDKNLNLVNMYINLNCKKGYKNKFYKNYNLALDNLYFLFNNFSEKDTIFKEDYSFMKYLNNYNMYLCNMDFNNILELEISKHVSVFEIKSFKNSKSIKKLKKEKYSYEVVYIPKERRVKYVLRSLSLYERSFKNFFIWERIFWSLLNTLKDENSSFLFKKKNYLCQKSIKFFGKKR